MKPGRTAVVRGAVAVPSAVAIASAAEIVLTCLPSLPALRHVVFGADGLCAGTVIKTFVDLSTADAI